MVQGLAITHQRDSIDAELMTPALSVNLFREPPTNSSGFVLHLVAEEDPHYQETKQGILLRRMSPITPSDTKLPLPQFLKVMTNNNVPVKKAIAAAGKMCAPHIINPNTVLYSKTRCLLADTKTTAPQASSTS